MADGGLSLYLLTAAAIGTGAYAQYESGKAAQYEYKSRADEEKVAAKDREIARRNRLLKALASRNVASAAGGTSLEGTDIALVNRDFSEYSLDESASSAMTKARVRSLNAAGSSAKRIGTINAASTLFSGAARLGLPPKI